jgi:hypothetical protein
VAHDLPRVVSTAHEWGEVGYAAALRNCAGWMQSVIDGQRADSTENSAAYDLMVGR